MVEIKQSQYRYPDITSGMHTNGPANTFVRQQPGEWFVVTERPTVGVRAMIEKLGFEKFVRVHCQPIEVQP